MCQLNPLPHHEDDVDGLHLLVFKGRDPTGVEARVESDCQQRLADTTQLLADMLLDESQEMSTSLRAILWNV